ncbi:shTK domain protein [Ancylostoma ceylanicum]|uniref:ShTK domain protein n=1 Tax=Ancylostoma ceylanicum TaxID=53326 RepID=A0A0D6LUI4_9BILA|nr:shTK domain protein [Ancylostoma ceylanicum]
MNAASVSLLLIFIYATEAQLLSCTDAGIGPCVDKVNPKTGRSDCPSVAYLCNNSIYYTLMTEQCPKTCNRCNGATAAPTAAPPTVSTCQDLVDPRTGVSNCPQVAYLCRNPLYVSLMQQQCRRTCGYCT